MRLLSERDLTKNIIKSSRRFPMYGKFFRSRFKNIKKFAVYNDKTCIPFDQNVGKRSFLFCSDNKMAQETIISLNT